MARLNQKRLDEENNFLAISKDWKIITERILNNNNLLKLIHYTTSDALDKPNLTEEEKEKLINKNILCYPYVPEDNIVQNYIEILFDSFFSNKTNPQYVDNTIIITILCHKDNWILNNWQMRLYMIANELMNLINKKKLTGIGITEFIGANAFVPSQDLIGLTLNFLVVNSVNIKE